MGRKKKKEIGYDVIVSVLQNGTTLSKAHYPATKNLGVLELSNQGNGPLSLPHYPFPNNSIEFIRMDGKNIFLLVNYKWEGFTTSSGELVNINRRLKGVEEIKLGRGDYGSISYKDIRIMFKIDVYKPKKFERPSKRDRSYIPSLLSLALPFREERQNFAIGIACSLLIFALIVAALFTTPTKVPTSIDQLPPEYILPFVEKEYFSTAPERLQNDLDRDQLVASVFNHYRALTELILGWQGYDKSLLFSSTIERYEATNQRASDKVEALKEMQSEVDTKVLANRNSALLLMPAVMGESINGKILRGVDKISSLHAALADSLERRKVFSKEYAEIVAHDFEEYRNIRKRRGGLSKLSRIKPWARLTNEQLMYKEAQDVADSAYDMRYFIDSNISPEDKLDLIKDSPVAVPREFRYGSGIGGVDFMALDDRLYLIEASVFGGPYKAKAIKEPLIGELDPKLVSKYIRKHRFQLQQCYELALRRNELAKGTMEWSWRIDSRGIISDISLLKSSIADKKMSRCISKYISKWRFPRPRRGSVEVSYPFEFSPSKG